MNIVKFHPQAPAINRAKGLDMVMAYPLPTQDSPFALTPLSILYPGKMFEDRGMRVEYWDQRFDPPGMLEDLMHDTKQVAVSCFTGHQCAYAADILIRAKEIDPRIITHVGGHHARLCTDDVRREPFVDQVWPERSYHEHSFPFSKAAQRLWRRGDLQMITSTGCSYGCTFCCLASPWNPRDMAKFRGELEAVYELTGFNTVSFSDPNIVQGVYRGDDGKRLKMDRVERMREIGAALRVHGMKWDGNLRCDYIEPELVDAMVWSGCFSIEFGAESGNDYFLRKVIHKGHGPEDTLNANKLIAGTGISVMNSFVRGMPYETHEQWLDTMRLIDNIMEAAPEARASVYRFTPYPGCPAYEQACEGKGIEKFYPPKTMREWGERKLMADPTYWTTGLCFRLDNTEKNFPGDDWKLIEPYVLKARRLWAERRPEDFTLEDVARVEALIEFQVRKHTGRSVVAA